MGNVVPFGKSEEMPGVLLGCLLAAEQEELREITSESAKLQQEMDVVQTRYRKFVLRTLDRMGAGFDENTQALLFSPDTGEVWATNWEDLQKWNGGEKP